MQASGFIFGQRTTIILDSYESAYGLPNSVSLGVTAEALYERLSVQNRRFCSNWGGLTQNFR